MWQDAIRSIKRHIVAYGFASLNFRTLKKKSFEFRILYMYIQFL